MSIFNQQELNMKQYTYKQMTTAAKKLEMKDQPIFQLGAQNGGFGFFHAHFLCLSGEGAESLKKEIAIVADRLGKTSTELIEELPILRSIFEVQDNG